MLDEIAVNLSVFKHRKIGIGKMADLKSKILGREKRC
jgi:hypothetical protein